MKRTLTVRQSRVRRRRTGVNPQHPESIPQCTFFNLRLSFLVFFLFAGALLALLARANARALVHDHLHQPKLVPFGHSGSVEEAWVARYDGPGDSLDQATAIAVDGSGNVYVTGLSSGSGTGDDYATIKYNSVGQQQWVARYNGPGNDDDDATAIAVDGSGNVYVVGMSVGTTYPNFDYATVKYNSAGQQQWVARYNGPGDLQDMGEAIAVDSLGNVYVTGKSFGSSTNFDYATIKYNSAGQQQWVARYNGPGNGGDEATAIAIDDSGNVYVTGFSYDPDALYDYATIKYNSAGQQQWVARYNGPANGDDQATAIAVDNSLNVYVTGSSLGSGGYDYATIKYDSTGQQQWVARYNGPANNEDEATAIAVNDSGDVYVTGWSLGPNLYHDYATVKYNSAGQQQWVARYNGPGDEDDRANAIAVESSGDVYVTGWSAGSGTGYDYATIKYSSAGQQEWVARYDGPASSGDLALAMAVDSSGGVYVTGESEGWNSGSDYATIKYVQRSTPTPTPCTGRCAPTPRPRRTPAPRP